MSAETTTSFNLAGRSFLKEADFTKTESTELIDLAERLRADKRAGREVQPLIGRNIALIFEKTSTRTRSAFEVGAHDQGGHVTYLGPGESQIGHKESIKDTARVLGRISTASSTAAQHMRTSKSSPATPGSRCGTASPTPGIRPRCSPTS